MKDVASSNLIETVLQRSFPSSRILDYSIKSGSGNCENFLGVIQALDVQLETKSLDGRPIIERKHLVLKTSSENPARKEFTGNLNVFNKEVTFYTDFIPELNKYLENNGRSKIVSPPFVKCYGADSSYVRNNMKCEGSSNCFHCQPNLPFDYILMDDLREVDEAYRMGNRFLGLDLAHCKLVITELARYHALSYAYMKTMTTPEFYAKFPCFKENVFTVGNEVKVKELYASVSQASLKILAKAYSPDSNEFQKLEKLVTGFVPIAEHFIAGSNDLNLDEMLSTPVGLANVNLGQRERKERNQWLVMTHGDLWTNNILFKYSGDLPTAMKFIDLQVVREMCLTTDLTFFLCMSTTSETRKKHLHEFLELYYEAFKNTCKILKAEPWSDFTLENLEIKYKNGLTYGGALSLCVLPLTLLPTETACDLEKDSTQDQLYGSAFEDSLQESEVTEKRVLAVAEDLLVFDVVDN